MRIERRVTEIGVIYINGVNSTPFVKKCENTLDKTTRMGRTRCFILSSGLCEPPLVYSIVWKMTGEVIGHAIFHSYEKNDYEIGWVLSKDYWGIGIADEVTKELIKCARQLGAESCVIECDERQIASKKIASKNGFVYEDKSDNLERYRLVL